MADATNGGDSARLGSHELKDEDGRERRDRTGRFEGVRVAKSGAQTPRSGRDRRHMASLAGGQTLVWRRGCTVEALETTVYSLNDFDLNLTR